jgi:alpha-tubulin suppressor-like RCC1 family protein
MDPAKSWASGKKSFGTWLFLIALAMATGIASCSDGTTEPPEEDPEEPGPDATEVFPGLTVSDAESAATGGALAAANEEVTYVSACPGTFTDADEVTITNLASGESKTVPLVDGGFDPVTLEAEPGDELEILVHHRDGSTSRYLTRVPARKRPRVVRTVPPKDATDVVLSASVLVVFSEPVDGSTVTAETILLQLNGEPVDGTLTLSDDGVMAELIPAESLLLGGSYTLVISTGVLDLQGDALEEELQVTFTTETYTETYMASVGAGWWHTCALTVDGSAYCWAANWWGQLGRPASDEWQPPFPALTSLKFASLGLGSGHTCGVTVSGQAYCWGWNDYGRLGDGTQTHRSRPVPVSGGFSFVSLTAGYEHTCGLTTAGAAYCWGGNAVGQLGTTNDFSLVPVPVSGGLTFTSLNASGGFNHTCGLTAGGAAYCWGMNSRYQLGSTTVGNCISYCSRTPVPVSGGLSFTSLTAGYEHTCGLTASGAAYCWGSNDAGQLGVDELANFNASPVAVQGGHSFVSIVAGMNHTCGVTSGGETYCWGTNATGQLGIGGVGDRFSQPSKVFGGHTFHTLAMWADHTCGVSSEGDVYCWGSNDAGQLGYPSSELSESAVPLRVQSLPSGSE